MGRNGIDVRSNHIRLHAIAVDFRWGKAMIDRVEHREKRVGLVGPMKLGKGKHGPTGGMRILTAIFADSRRISFDVAWIEGCLVKRRSKKHGNLVVWPNELFFDFGHRQAQ